MKADRRWLAWLVGVLGSFGYLEGRALYTRKDSDTLSATLRRWMGIHPYRRGHRAFETLFTVLVAFFVAHILNRDTHA